MGDELVEWVDSTASEIKSATDGKGGRTRVHVGLTAAGDAQVARAAVLQHRPRRGRHL